MMGKPLLETKAMGQRECVGNLRDKLRELAAMTATVLQAESCRIELNEDKAEIKSLAEDFRMTISARGSAAGPELDAAYANSVMQSPILFDGRTIGVVRVERASRKPHFSEGDEQTLSTVAALASSLHRTAKLQSKSDTQRIRISTGHQEITSISGMAGLTQCPHQMARIVAKLFYREMTKAGFSQNQIIKVASEIISELSVSVRRHSRRMTSEIS